MNTDQLIEVIKFWFKQNRFTCSKEISRGETLLRVLGHGVLFDPSRMNDLVKEDTFKYLSSREVLPFIIYQGSVGENYEVLFKEEKPATDFEKLLKFRKEPSLYSKSLSFLINEKDFRKVAESLYNSDLDDVILGSAYASSLL